MESERGMAFIQETTLPTNSLAATVRMFVKMFCFYNVSLTFQNSGYYLILPKIYTYKAVLASF